MQRILKFTRVYFFISEAKILVELNFLEIQGFNVSGGCCVTSCTKDKDAPLLRQV